MQSIQLPLCRYSVPGPPVCATTPSPARVTCWQPSKHAHCAPLRKSEEVLTISLFSGGVLAHAPFRREYMHTPLVFPFERTKNFFFPRGVQRACSSVICEFHTLTALECYHMTAPSERCSLSFPFDLINSMNGLCPLSDNVLKSSRAMQPKETYGNKFSIQVLAACKQRLNSEF